MKQKGLAVPFLNSAYMLKAYIKDIAQIPKRLKSEFKARFRLKAC